VQWDPYSLFGSCYYGCQNTNDSKQAYHAWQDSLCSTSRCTRLLCSIIVIRTLWGINISWAPAWPESISERSRIRLQIQRHWLAYGRRRVDGTAWLGHLPRSRETPWPQESRARRRRVCAAYRTRTYICSGRRGNGCAWFGNIGFGIGSGLLPGSIRLKSNWRVSEQWVLAHETTK
jgi:hypothetical protein